MSEIESKRIGKVAIELGVKADRILEVLTNKGHKGFNPNSKISMDIYQQLLVEFQGDKVAKEETKQASIASKAHKEVVAAPVEVAHVEEEKVSKKPEAEILIKDVHGATAAASKAKEPAKKAAKAEVKEEVVEVKAEEKSNVKVVGKIDLDSINSKTKPGRKTKAEKEEEKETKKTTKEKASAKKEEEKPTAKKGKGKKTVEEEKTAEPIAEIISAPVVVEIPVEEKPEPPKEDLHVTNYQKLGGPVILGRMDLPVKEEKKKPTPPPHPGAGGGGGYQGGDKKKRKRIKQAPVKPNEIVGDNKPKAKDTPGSSTFNRDNKPGGGGGNRFNKPADTKGAKPEINDEEIQRQIKETLARLSGAGKSAASKYRREKRQGVQEKIQVEIEQQEQEKKVLKVTEFVSANELASMMSVPVNNIISTCMSLGMFVSINQRLDAEAIGVVAEEFGYTVQFVTAEETVDVIEEEDNADDLVYRAPIVTVMGHVDHGKTSLLDYIRKANVIAGEAGGITQHIGAYSVDLANGKRIAFLDTPGHEAFTAMRARGAKVTDVVIVVVAADDNVMPQTKEAINHAQAAGVPIVFAINKVDKQGANPDKIREELSAMNILVEEWGGKYQCQEISAKKGTGIDTLLDKVLLEAEMLDLKANPKKNAIGTVIESSLDKGKGYIATVMVQAGTLKVGDTLLAGCFSGRVKALNDERGKPMKSAGPSMPAVVLGLSGAPQAGDHFKVMDDERQAREIATKRLQLQREQGYRTTKHITLDEIGRRLAIGDFKELKIIIKGDVDGSVEALTDSLLKLSTAKISVNVIMKAVGPVTESDVLLASASDAIIVAFNVRPSLNARKLAETEQIDIRSYSIIYNAINEIKDAMEGMLAPEFEEKIVCNVEIREVFNITKVGTIAGCMVLDGKITRNTKIRIIRDGIVVHTGELGSLKRFKDDVKEVTTGYECGLNINNFNDIKQGDVIEGYENVEIKAKL